jgi:hypothetical protein
MGKEGIVVIVILLIVIIWGLVGGGISESVGVTCDFGFGSFCWVFHKNVIGDIGSPGCDTVFCEIKKAIS